MWVDGAVSWTWWVPLILMWVIGLGSGCWIRGVFEREARDRWESEVTRGRLLHPSTRQGEKWED